jgi:hypothetical protein
MRLLLSTSGMNEMREVLVTMMMAMVMMQMAQHQ